MVGSKITNLLKLKDAGFKVPEFVVVDASMLGSKSVQDIVAYILDSCDFNLFAVRSAALIEDQLESAMAGQFKTMVNVSVEGLEVAISNVIEHAKEFLKGDLSQFSLFVQEYIEADYSGVCFTRSPFGGREMIIEYHQGIGEDLVSGKVIPNKEVSFWPVNNFKFMAKYADVFKEIESIFGFAQDIEWVVYKGELYILQSRNITSLSANQFEACRYLDEVLPKGSFKFEKTEISEVMPRPTNFGMSLLHKIYSDGGSVCNVYAKYGVKYKFQDFLKIVGNELYVDRYLEKKTLSSFWNFFAFSSINASEEKFVELKDALKLALNRTSTDHELVDFLKDYDLIFEVNLLASKLLSRVSDTIGRELDMSKFLNLDIGNLDIQFAGEGLKGNSLDLMDDSNFVKVESNRQQLDLSFLPNWKIGLYAERLLLLNKFMYLREVARWLTVKGINQIKASLSDLDLFRAIDEHDVSKDELSKRKQNYDFYNKYELPAILSNELQIDLGKSKGVSSGLAKGELVAEVIGSNEQILYVRNLTPSLVQFFPLIKGIISEKGGMLSHCAIMAREKGIPVVVNFDLSKSKIKLGDQIQINGDTGEVIL